MKAISLILFILFDLTIFGQDHKTGINCGNSHCSIIIDSLNRINYFNKAKQVNFLELPTKFSFRFYKDGGDFVNIPEFWEFYYSDNLGYIIAYNSQKEEQIFSFTDKHIINDIIEHLNVAFVLDSTLLVFNPTRSRYFADIYASIDLYLKYPNGMIISNSVSYGSITKYCNYLLDLLYYFESLNKLKFKKLDINSAYFLSVNYNSNIANNYISKLNQSLQKINPNYPDNILIDQYKMKIDTIIKNN